VRPSRSMDEQKHDNSRMGASKVAGRTSILVGRMIASGIENPKNRMTVVGYARYQHLGLKQLTTGRSKKGFWRHDT
jgi:hypothetical protein